VAYPDYTFIPCKKRCQGATLAENLIYKGFAVIAEAPAEAISVLGWRPAAGFSSANSEAKTPGTWPWFAAFERQ
jgi:hypothetical protein